MRRFLVPVFAAFVLAAGAGCADTSDDETGASLDELRSLTIKESDNNKTFDIEKGQSFKVALGQTGGGYKWKVVSTTRSLGYPDPVDGVFQSNPNGPTVGGAGQQVFTWQTSNPTLRPSATAHAVKLEYRRPWESEDAPATKTFKFKVKIKQGAAPPPPDAAEPIVLFEEHNDSEINATDGQDLKIRLAENPTAGYRWYVVSDGALPEPQSEFDGPGANGPVGAGGTRVLTWETAGKVGTYTIKLKYSRGVSGTASKTFQVKLNVAAAGADNGYECPTARSLNCMPPTNGKAYCKRDFRTWAEANCDVSYLD